VFSASASRVRGLKADRLLSAKIAHSLRTHRGHSNDLVGIYMANFPGYGFDDRVGGKSL
jgi:hypothetical protein